jgi:hypothetical protein
VQKARFSYHYQSDSYDYFVNPTQISINDFVFCENQIALLKSVSSKKVFEMAGKTSTRANAHALVEELDAIDLLWRPIREICQWVGVSMGEKLTRMRGPVARPLLHPLYLGMSRSAL